MRLSFVIPAYNEQDYLPACIELILEQIDAGRTGSSQEAIEIVVVNNASTDATREAALRYPGVRVVDEPRKGLTFARQAGFAASYGSLIANVDADSRLTPGWIATALATFAADPELVALSGPLVYYDLTRQRRVLVYIFYLAAFASYALNRYVLRVGSMVQGGNFVLTRTSLEAIRRIQPRHQLLRRGYGHRLPPEQGGQSAFHVWLEDVLLRASPEGRRHFTTAARYTINFIWTTFLKRPYSRTHIDICEQLEG